MSPRSNLMHSGPFDVQKQVPVSPAIASDEWFDSGSDSRPMNEDAEAAKELEDALQTLWRKWAIAWRNIASASAWVEELRGNRLALPERGEPSGRISERPESDKSRFEG